MNRLTKLFRLGLSALALAVLPWFKPFPQTDTGDEGTQIHVTQIDPSEFPKIRVYLSVTDPAGEPIGVDAGRLHLSENGVEMAPEQVSGKGEIGSLTTMLVMDVSGSMNEGGKLDAAKAAARAYVDQMRSGDRAGLMSFNTAVEYVEPVTADREALAKAIDSLKARRDTAMFDALVNATQVLETIEGRKAIIVLTDGLDNRSTHTGEQVIEHMGASGLSVSAIGLGDPSQRGVTNAGLDETALRWLADRAGGGYGYASDSDTLRALFERYGRALQSEYVITYRSPATLRDGVNRTLTVSLAAASVTSRAEYNPGGVVPEVARRAPWTLFAAALAGLLVLLLVPALITRGAAAVRGARTGRGKARTNGSRIRLQNPPQPRIRLRRQANRNLAPESRPPSGGGGRSLT